MNKEEVQQFYKENEPVLPPFYKWKHFRFKDMDNVWHKCPRINNAKKLQNFLIKYPSTNVYYSCGNYLNPHYLGNRYSKKQFKNKCKKEHKDNWKEYYRNNKWKVLLNNFYMSSDFIIDMDNETKEQAFILYNHLHNLFPDKDIDMAETGRGFHIAVRKLITSDPSLNPIQNEFRDIEIRKKLISNLKQDGFSFDYKVSESPRQIFRCLNTMHQSGKVITFTESMEGYALSQ